VIQILEQETDLRSFAGPGHWNDPHMLDVGTPGLSLEESRSHFSLRAMLAAPLMAGNDLRSMPADIREVLTNKEVIAVDQDALGHQGQRYRDYGDTEVWRKELAGDTEAYLLLNRSESPKEMLVYVGTNKRVRDLWKHVDLGPFTDGFFHARVVPHGVVMVKVLTR
jgi:alpha-galactosidase